MFLMTRRVTGYAEDWYFALGWKVNMRLYKKVWIVGSITFIAFGAVQIAGLIKI